VFLIKQKNDKQSSSTPSQTPPNNNQDPPSKNPKSSAEQIKEKLKTYLKIDNYLNLPECQSDGDKLVVVLYKEGKAVGKENYSFATMTEKDKQEIEELSQQILFGRPGKPEQKYWEFTSKKNQEIISVFIVDNHPALINLTIHKRKLYLATGIDKIKIEIISKNGLDFKCKFVELEDQITFAPFS
ncbi:21084_t:CDS:2, partial [Racocetra persica]